MIDIIYFIASITIGLLLYFYGYWRGFKARDYTVKRLSVHCEELESKLYRISNWIKAYPLEVFPEPDFKKVAKVLKESGLTLDSVSASNMRHVLNGIDKIINAETIK